MRTPEHRLERVSEGHEQSMVSIWVLGAGRHEGASRPDRAIDLQAMFKFWHVRFTSTEPHSVSGGD